MRYAHPVKPANKAILSEILFILAIVVGTFLRLYQLTTQIVLEDEIHAITTLISKNYLNIALSFGSSDHCIPLTIIYKIFSQTIGLSEIGMHCPIVIFGIATLIVFPLLARRYIGMSARNIFAWLLAISPMHILYSRFARSYCISTFLAFVGVIAFYKWWTEQKRHMMYVYIFCAVIGPYFHLTILPFVLTPFLLIVGVYIFDKKNAFPFSIKEITQFFLMVVLGLLFFLLGPSIYDTTALADKAINNLKAPLTEVDGHIIFNVMRLMFGAWNKWIVLISLLFCGFGAICAARQKKYFLLYCLCLSIAQIGAVTIIQPAYIFVPRVSFRYCFTLLPILFLFIAYGLAHPYKYFYPSKRKRIFYRGIIVSFFGALLYLGPLQYMFSVPNQWLPCSIHKGIVTTKHQTKKHSLSKFYYYLNSLPPESVFIVEAPWFFFMDNDINESYQKIHRQRMGIGFINEIGNQDRWGEGEFNSNADGLEFKYFINLCNARSFIERHVNFLILHKDLKAEMEKLNVPFLGYFPPYKIEPVMEYSTRNFGPPIFEDETIIVFKVTPLQNLQLDQDIKDRMEIKGNSATGKSAKYPSVTIDKSTIQ